MDGKSLEEITREEVEHALQDALGELDEVNEMRLAVLGQTGVHIGMVALKQYENRFARDQKRCEERISQIRARLTAWIEDPA